MHSLEKRKKPQIRYVVIHFKNLNKEKQNKSKGNRRKEIIKNRNQWNWEQKIEKKSMKLKAGFLKRLIKLTNL